VVCFIIVLSTISIFGATTGFGAICFGCGGTTSSNKFLI
jgi:hypothetical protein